ncbi:RNA dependent RNA polymerase-domain-containing protein [Apodospora peruviana]|uniref:RNA-dependent RNA polymerase n=1 Tax=Apodospora peruviana TaxID=516989 RepID=A0AAE0HXB4_9PEZI|nr:RNA dependent RNA polymerase-domain-containing protein [Apodospora peruviana]
MEVFLRNVPQHLTDWSLQSQLKPLMDQLSINEATYQCDKRKHKNIGHITFLHKSDGDRFLARHGEEVLPEQSAPAPNARASNPPNLFRDGQKKKQHPRTKSRLFIMNKHIPCKISNRKPSALALRSMEYEIEQHQQRKKMKKQTQPEKAEELPVRFYAVDMSCGYWVYIDGSLTFVPEWTDMNPCHAKFTKRSLVITMPNRRTKVRIPFPIIQEMVWSENGNIAVTLNSSPTFLNLQSGEVEDHLSAAFSSFTLESLYGPPQPVQYLRLPCIDDSHSRVSGFCLVYCFRVQDTKFRRGSSFSDFHGKIRKLKNKELINLSHYDFEILSPRAAGMAPFDNALAALKTLLGNYHTSGSMSFRLLFMLQRLAYESYLHPRTVAILAMRLHQVFSDAKMRGSQVPISEDAFKKLFQWIDYPSPHGDPRKFEVDGIMEYLATAEAEFREGLAVDSELFTETDSLIRIYRAIVTPTQILLDEGMEAKNRILRKYPEHLDYFIRIQFSDENGQDLYFNSKISLDQIYERFKSVLARGIGIAGRGYAFLGFSHSSLRSHSVWLSAPFYYDNQLHLPELIITSLGDFRKINSPARRAARIGQAFSETPYTVSLDDYQIQVVRIGDVERNDRVFSDGVGPISREAMEAIYDVIPQSKRFPTCFQIRWGGAKGMLTLDPSLKGCQFGIRPSMEKFATVDKINTHLEICDMASKPIPLVLNRQLVKILEDMGAPESWFFEQQDKEIMHLRNITASVDNTAKFLKRQSVGDAINLYRFLRYTNLLGIDYRRDSFLYGVVNAVVLKELRLLKHKARIPISEGMTLFGVMDETGYLKEGEVFVTYDTMDGRHDDPPDDCDIIVTRSPALHPGDIQLARNVIPPDGHPLGELNNCIVFSQKGHRDLPSQLSGGDLDGDVFNVIWDPNVVDVVRTFPPASYARVKPLELDRPVESSDMANFFIDFMKTDHLGVIATRHMILADQRPTGTLDPDCRKLAELHSSAVDFSKTGHPVSLNQLPKGGRWRPDFLAPGPQAFIHNKSVIEMDQHVERDEGDDEDDEDDEDGPRHRYYASERLLGKLYRAIDEQKIWDQDVRKTLPQGGASFWDLLITAFRERVSTIGPIEWQHRSDEARRLCHAYEDAILSIMIDSSEHPGQPLKELEVFVGFIINKSGVQTRRQRDRSTRLKDEFDRITAWIMKQMRTPASSLATGHTSQFDALELCLACVHIGCLKQPIQITAYSRPIAQEVESFRVVAACALIRELNLLEQGMTAHKRGGGGYVGVR